MKFKMITKNEMMLWLSGLIVVAFLVAGIFEVLDLFIVKLILFSCFSFIVANIYFYLFDDENEKSPDDDIDIE